MNSDLIESIEEVLKSEMNLIKSYEGNQGVSYKIGINDKNYLIKKANKKNWIFKFFNQYTLKKEYAIYSRLNGVRGVPNCYGLTQDGDLILEYIEGLSYRKKQEQLADDDEFFKSFLDLILEMHGKGVAHGDLKRKDNIIVSNSNKPYLIDFGTAITINSKSNQIKKSIFSFLKKTDLNAWIKHKYSRQYDRIEEDDFVYYSSSTMDKLIRLTRKFWRTLTFRRFRKKRGQKQQ